MFTIKAIFEAGPVWIAGLAEVTTLLTTRDPHPYDFMASDEGQEFLGIVGDPGISFPGRIDGGVEWTLLRVRPAEGDAYNLAVPTGFTFLMNEAGATIDRI